MAGTPPKKDDASKETGVPPLSQVSQEEGSYPPPSQPTGPMWTTFSLRSGDASSGPSTPWRPPAVPAHVKAKYGKRPYGVVTERVPAKVATSESRWTKFLGPARSGWAGQVPSDPLFVPRPSSSRTSTRPGPSRRVASESQVRTRPYSVPVKPPAASNVVRPPAAQNVVRQPDAPQIVRPTRPSADQNFVRPSPAPSAAPTSVRPSRVPFAAPPSIQPSHVPSRPRQVIQFAPQLSTAKMGPASKKPK